MPAKNVVVFSEPKKHYLEYGSCFFEALAKQPHPGVTVIETDGTAEDNERKIAEHDPIIWYSVGHGLWCAHTVECIRPFIECEWKAIATRVGVLCESDSNLSLFRGRVVHLLSCMTGLLLGEALVRRGGAVAYIGYFVSFYFGVMKRGEPMPDPCTPPDDKRDLYSFNDSDVEGERELLRGKSVGEAVDAMKRKFQEYYDKYTKGEWKDRWVAPYAYLLLRWDMYGLKTYGDLTFTPCSGALPAPPAPEWIAASATAVVGMTLGGIAAHHEELEELFR